MILEADRGLNIQWFRQQGYMAGSELQMGVAADRKKNNIVTIDGDKMCIGGNIFQRRVK
jgi:hypothetical protein